MLDNTSSSFRKNDIKKVVPLPDWPSAISRWGLCWDFHIYVFCVLYLILTVISGVIFLRFRFRVRKFKIVFNTLILLATSGVFRLVFMLVDPYGYKGNIAGMMVGIMMQAVYPLYCACYGLTQVTVFRITKADVGHVRLRTLSCLFGCTLTYLFLVVVIETVVFYERSLKLFLLLDSGCFIVWSLSLGISFICSGFRLTQHTSDIKGAQKELNSRNNDPSSVSNTTGFSIIPNPNSDTNIQVFSVDLRPTTPDKAVLDTTTSAAGDISTTGATGARLSQINQPSNSLLPASDHYSDSSARVSLHSNSSVSRSRRRRKVSNHGQMIIAIASDSDNRSTSSTDIERLQPESTTRRKRAKKRHRQKKTLIRRSSRSDSLISPSVSCMISVKEDDHVSTELTLSCRKNQNTGYKELQRCIPKSNSNTYLAVSTELTNSAHGFDLPSISHYRELLLNAPDTTGVISPELPLLASSYLYSNPKNTNSKNNGCERLNYNGDEDEGDKENHVKDTHIEPCGNPELFTIASEDNTLPKISFPTKTDLIQNKQNLTDASNTASRGNQDSLENGYLIDVQRNEGQQAASNQVDSQNDADTNESLNPVESALCSIITESDQATENGYLADTEHVMHSLSLNRLKSSIRQRVFRHKSSSLPRRSSTSSSSDETTSSQELSSRSRSNSSICSGPLPSKQTNMIQGAIYLTYILTFLFLFACLLQLYTLFGVYGVLGTIPVPDPWPWLIFQSVFRFTEICIGSTIAAIAFIALNHRHQRTIRHQQQHRLNHQQQQHVDATVDCIV